MHPQRKVLKPSQVFIQYQRWRKLFPKSKYKFVYILVWCITNRVKEQLAWIQIIRRILTNCCNIRSNPHRPQKMATILTYNNTSKNKIYLPIPWD